MVFEQLFHYIHRPRVVLVDGLRFPTTDVDEIREGWFDVLVIVLLNYTDTNSNKVSTNNYIPSGQDDYSFTILTPIFVIVARRRFVYTLGFQDPLL